MRKIFRLTKICPGFDNLKDFERIQLATLIDTDGSIKISEHKYPCIYLGMSSELPVLMWEIYGGYIGKRYPEGKIHYEWEVGKRGDVKSFLLAIEPYLIIKQQQARIAIKMINLLEKKPPRYKEELRRLAKEVSDLNNALSPDIDLEEWQQLSLNITNLKESPNPKTKFVFPFLFFLYASSFLSFS